MARGTVSTLYTKTVTLPSGFRRIQHATIVPYASGNATVAKSAGICGVYSYDSTSITFFSIPVNIFGTGGGEGCSFLYDVSLQMN